MLCNYIYIYILCIALVLLYKLLVLTQFPIRRRNEPTCWTSCWRPAGVHRAARRRARTTTTAAAAVASVARAAAAERAAVATARPTTVATTNVSRPTTTQHDWSADGRLPRLASTRQTRNRTIVCTSCTGCADRKKVN